MEKYAEEKAKKDRQAAYVNAQKEKQRRVTRLAAGRNIVSNGLVEAGKWAGAGAVAGSVLLGVGTLGGALAGRIGRVCQRVAWRNYR